MIPDLRQRRQPARRYRGYALLFEASLALWSLSVLATDPDEDGRFPSRLLWGDTHVHTTLSADANIIGNLSFTPAMAYQFAKGQRVTTSTGQFAQLARPLDFLVVADHAEYFGLLPALRSDRGAIDPVGSEGSLWLDKFLSGEGDKRPEALTLVRTFSSGKPLLKAAVDYTSQWHTTIEAAEVANDPGHFVALVGFEWTSQPSGNNLHRVVIFKDGPDKTSTISPLSSFDSFDPEHLWDFLADYETNQKGSALAIPHNGNLSNGLMFSDQRFNGSAMDSRYASKRARWEPVVEVTQIKGDGEAHPTLSPDDEFADFGTWDGGNLDSSSKKQPWMLRYEYARSALRLGLDIEQRTGVNPFRFGMIGSTDSHSGLATADDDNFWGKGPPWEPRQLVRIDAEFIRYEDGYAGNVMGWDQLASGYAAVWAEDNTRSAVFDAIKRREVYATTGPRIKLRVFAGWDFERGDDERADLAEWGYRHGVPMGGVIRGKTSEENNGLRLIVVAQRDPEGANLDRVQVVKGWIDTQGKTHEKVFDIVWSGDRALTPAGQLRPVGSTVDTEQADYANTLGAAELRRVWRDPEFDAAVPAFYYVRVLEIPTPRWPAYDRVRQLTALPEGINLTHQERVYSSPIWFEPRNR